MQVTQKSLKIIMLTLGLAVLAAACSGVGSNPLAVNTSEGDSALAVNGADRAPDIVISLYQGQETLGGESVRLSELQNNGQPIVLNFWAGLCPPCRIEMPDLERVYQNHLGEILLIGVDVGPFTNLGSRDEGRQLLQDLNVSYPAGTTFNESVLQNYRVLGMPSTYFIKPDGTIHETWSGLLTEDKLEELVEDLLAASEAS